MGEDNKTPIDDKTAEVSPLDPTLKKPASRAQATATNAQASTAPP